MKITKKEITILVVMLFLISGALYYYYFLTPKLAEIDIMESQISQVEQQIQQMNIQIGSIDAKKQEVELLKQDLNVEKEVLPLGLSHPIQLVRVSEILRDLSLNQNIVFETGAATNKTYQVNRVFLSFDTTYAELLQIFGLFNEHILRNQIVTSTLAYTESNVDYYAVSTETDDGEKYTDLKVDMAVEFFSFYKPADTGTLPIQDFETSPTEGKSPFSPVVR